MNRIKLRSILLIICAILLCGIVAHFIVRSGRGAGGRAPDAGLILASKMISQPSLIKNALAQMIAAGHAPENITFTGTKSPNDVFGDEQIGDELTPPPDACVSQPCSDWKYLSAVKKDYGWYVYGVGTPATDIIAYLPNITPAVCRALQKGLGYKGPVPPKQSGIPFDAMKPGAYFAKGSATTIKSQDGTLDGQQFGCFDNSVSNETSNFSYYYVMYAQ